MNKADTRHFAEISCKRGDFACCLTVCTFPSKHHPRTLRHWRRLGVQTRSILVKTCSFLRSPRKNIIVLRISLLCVNRSAKDSAGLVGRCATVEHASAGWSIGACGCASRSQIGQCTQRHVFPLGMAIRGHVNHGQARGHACRLAALH